MTTHPDPEDLFELLSGQLAHTSARKWVLHHLEICGDCRQRFFAAFDLQSMRQLADLVADGETLRLEVRKELRQARRALEAFEGVPFFQVQRAIAADPSLQSWGMADLLLDRCHELWSAEPREALLRAECAAAFLDARLEVDPQDFETCERAARAWAYVGNVRRILSDLTGAHEAFALAWERYARGYGELAVRAEILDMEASLRRAQRRFADGERVIREAIELYYQLGRPDLAGKALLNHATMLWTSGDLEPALAALDRALFTLDVKTQPRLRLAAFATRLQILFDGGRWEEVVRALPNLHQLAQQHGGRLDRIRCRWFEARVQLEQGHLATAEELLTETRDAFIREGLAYDAALASLDLALLFVQQGRTPQIKELALGMLPIFEAQDVHREAWAALLLFRRAAREEVATLSLIRQVRTHLEQVRDGRIWPSQVLPAAAGTETSRKGVDP